MAPHEVSLNVGRDAEEFTSRSQAYYADGEQVRGVWQGRLADHFGLQGEVRPDQFARLSEGRHPWTGGQLIEQHLTHSYKTDAGKTITTIGNRAGPARTSPPPTPASP